jgi:hypothetical protein
MTRIARYARIHPKVSGKPASTINSGTVNATSSTKVGRSRRDTMTRASPAPRTRKGVKAIRTCLNRPRRDSSTCSWSMTSAAFHATRPS